MECGSSHLLNCELHISLFTLLNESLLLIFLRFLDAFVTHSCEINIHNYCATIQEHPISNLSFLALGGNGRNDPGCCDDHYQDPRAHPGHCAQHRPDQCGPMGGGGLMCPYGCWASICWTRALITAVAAAGPGRGSDRDVRCFRNRKMIIVLGIIILIGAACVGVAGLLLLLALLPFAVCGGAVVLGILGWLWQRHHYNYWKRRNVPHIPATPIVGNVWRLLRYRCCFGDQFRELYEAPEAVGEAYVGIHVLHNHAILLREPTLIKRILVEDFAQFSSRFETTDPVGDTMGSQNLFFAKYEVWRDIHKIFTPFFAANKVRQMYGLLQQIGDQLEEHMELRLEAGNGISEVVEVKELCALFTTDIISSLAFGIEAHSLQQPNADFRRMCIEVNTPRPKRILDLFTIFFFPSWVRRMRAHLFSTEYERFMRKSMNFIMGERATTGAQRNDLIDIFLQLQRTHPMDSVVHKKDFYVAQAAFLMLAGFDTSSSTITFALYELAKHPEIQRNLRDELKAALQQSSNTQLSYESLSSLPYLRQVVDEVLRLYPPTAFLDRCCNASEGYDLEPWGPTRLARGTPVYISVLGLHRDPELWPEPNKFDPERFSPEERQQHTPTSYLPFGAGPRGCIGTILGLLEIKVGLFYILKNYRVETCDRTLPEMRFDPKTFVLAAEGGTYLRFVKEQLK
ncbi:probable cytochrome P450 6t1 [Scaptodrosophila lebanonensis]|uniref:Probable cytochrome P450 6t1 n=1 Tax=Drosophila lebanonensis TaxID=7225 RepID=A0A6J2TME6_DROLE|nr:probable cytochrome P450 6t1 [Scaptodrosophila lebanonensis]